MIMVFQFVCNVLFLLIWLACFRFGSLLWTRVASSFHVFVLRLAFVPVFFNMADKKRRRTDSVVDVEPRASELEDIAKLRFSGKAVREGHDFSSDATVPQEVAKVLEWLSQRSTAEVASGLIACCAAVCRMCRLCR